MTTPLDDLPPGSGFPTPTPDQWRRSVEAVLRKSGALAEDAPATSAVIDRLLGTVTPDELRLRPLYVESDAPDAGYPGLPPYTRGGRLTGSVAGWDVRALFVNPDPVAANTEILADLDHGVTSLWLRTGPNGIPVDGLATALDGVYLDLAGVTLEAGTATAEAARSYLDLLAARGITGERAMGNLGADPIGTAVRTGAPVDLTTAIELARRCVADHPRLRSITVDATAHHDAGGSDAQELAFSLAAGVSCLRALTEAGLSPAQAAGQLEFRYAATVDQFATIAKLRAARRLWHRVTEVCDAGESPQLQHAVTSSAMMTTRDPWVNMLRTTVACFAAGVGGADAVTVVPFDAAIGLSDSFARRIARNTHALLVEESHVARVIDPAGGSWYVETRTEELAEAAWAIFQRVETEGGLPAAFDLLRAELAETWRRRVVDLRHRRTPITGVSEFPDVAEKPVIRPPLPPPATTGLPVHRYAEEFEALRAEETTPVFLATLGPVAAHTARATFASNLFQAGGFRPVSAGATDTVDEVISAFRDSGTTIACVCGTDRLYAERALEVIRALRAEGATRVLLAGRASPELATEIDEPIFAGCDAIAVLRRLRGVSS